MPLKTRSRGFPHGRRTASAPWLPTVLTGASAASVPGVFRFRCSAAPTAARSWPRKRASMPLSSCSARKAPMPGSSNSLRSTCPPRSTARSAAARTCFRRKTSWMCGGSPASRIPACANTATTCICPADMYLEGSDQHRGWFQSSLLTSIGAYGIAAVQERHALRLHG